jgi:hypothetical protein
LQHNSYTYVCTWQYDMAPKYMHNLRIALYMPPPFEIDYLRSLTSTTSAMNESNMKPPKYMHKMAKSGHQNACALNPNIERIVAAGTSMSTPYYKLAWSVFRNDSR